MDEVEWDQAVSEFSAWTTSGSHSDPNSAAITWRVCQGQERMKYISCYFEILL